MPSLDAKPAKTMPWLVALLLTAAGLTIYKAATAPITYDEAYTYLRFARKHTGDILSNYEYPNNHMLHTIAVRLSTRTFGDSLWAIRLPGLIGGLALLAALVALGRRFEEPVRTGWPVATAFLPIVMEYNGLARGYSLGAAACCWAAWLLTDALRDARRPTPRSRTQNLRLLGVGLLFGFALGCVPTFGLFVAGLCAATALIRIVDVRPIRIRAALMDSVLIIAGTAPILIVAYGRVRMKPREWPWGFGDWQACNRAFWEHVLQWSGTLDNRAALAIGGLVGISTVVALRDAFRGRDIAPRLLLATFAFGVIALIVARSVLGTVWPLPRTLHWMAPFTLLAVFLALTAIVKPRRARNVTVCVVTVALITWSGSRWDARRFAGWEDNAAIPSALDAIEYDVNRPRGSRVRVHVPWEFDVCAEYAIRSRPDYEWKLMSGNEDATRYRIFKSDCPQLSTWHVLFQDAYSDVCAAHFDPP